ncbi:hypothetical protein BXU11_14750 [Flavobacterium sp. LM5]|uniref:hypothetical protein n=1 Tax=Flavobacterium sp. LM5 TaxID=1938610 RepID=UPI000993685A|nr:hypothetical protein [Flavobacterium sp. LM5]OOV25915.1 hypothetical protein BXU11_14750 [Flavobacterium sp. LM5]
MKASIIYTVAVSVVLISTLEIRLDKNNFGKIGTRRAAKINSSFKQNEYQKATVDFSKVQLAKTNFEVKKESPIVLVKPELVLEETPTVLELISSTQKSISFESAIIEETEKDETRALDFHKFNTLSYEEEAIEIPFTSNKEYTFEYRLNQEYTIIGDVDQNETQTLDFDGINTLAMYDEAIVLPSSTIESNTVDFNVVGEDNALSEVPLDFNWIETLQMFDEPIVTPYHPLTEKNLVITDYLDNTIIESNQ